MFSLFTLIEEGGGVEIAQLVVQFLQNFVSSAVFWSVIKGVFKYKQLGKDFEPFLPYI